MTPDTSALRQIMAALPAPCATRRLIALAGAPGSGKSTLASALAEALGASVVPMDGFHLDNRILTARGLLPRKGAPETFDAGGFLRLVGALHEPEDVYFPVFDRARDIAIAGAGCVGAACRTVVLEGNYLLFDAPVWRDLRPFWDVAVYLSVPEAALRHRLTARWLDHGLPPEEAAARAEGNDMANARLVDARRLPADLVVTN
ncbi:pantothenate kinase [Rhodovulum iodosum]|uniref:Pantothenate kinase n=1 Tax=Rhodovulum iodosum TaxID=68291 RepID=A0ABV3XQL4_9RHOB|nr:AAA family ATPase [Rhodovulum robiginosum]RSK32962.1 AAA family ATPase [Rhodovulum robiginosum]